MNAFLWVTAALCLISILGKLATTWSTGQADWMTLGDVIVNTGMVVWALCLLFR